MAALFGSPASPRSKQIWDPKMPSNSTWHTSANMQWQHCFCSQASHLSRQHLWPQKASDSIWHSLNTIQWPQCFAAKLAPGASKSWEPLGPRTSIEPNLAQIQQHAVTARFGSQACRRGRQKVGALGTSTVAHWECLEKYCQASAPENVAHWKFLEKYWQVSRS